MISVFKMEPSEPNAETQGTSSCRDTLENSVPFICSAIGSESKSLGDAQIQDACCSTEKDKLEKQIEQLKKENEALHNTIKAGEDMKEVAGVLLKYDQFTRIDVEINRKLALIASNRCIGCGDVSAQPSGSLDNAHIQSANSCSSISL